MLGLLRLAVISTGSTLLRWQRMHGVRTLAPSAPDAQMSHHCQHIYATMQTAGEPMHGISLPQHHAHSDVLVYDYCSIICTDNWLPTRRPGGKFQRIALWKTP